MIRYALACDEGHGFEAWFGSAEAYDEQADAGDEPSPGLECAGMLAVASGSSTAAAVTAAAPDAADAAIAAMCRRRPARHAAAADWRDGAP